MDPSDLKLILTTVADRDRSRQLARGLVENRLAACVNVGDPIESVYRWEGALREEEEIPLTVKTPSDRLEEAVRWIRENHPYDTPELLVLEVGQADGEYEAWAKEQTREG